MSRRNFVGRALCLAGGGMALWFFLLLSFFLLTDGRTLFGQSYRGDPEFQRYWVVNLLAVTVGAGFAWIGIYWRKHR